MTHEQIAALIATMTPEDKRAVLYQLSREDDLTGDLDEIATALGRRSYWNEIRSMAEDYKKRIGEFEDRESLMEDIEQTCDGHHDVIYTSCAMDVVRYSDSASAYVDEMGTDGLVKNGDINWSAMAYMAMRADLFEQLRAEGIDINDDPEEWAGHPANKSEDE